MITWMYITLVSDGVIIPAIVALWFLRKRKIANETPSEQAPHTEQP